MSTSRLPKWAETFIPTKEVAFTPIVISVNIIIWLIMLANGISPVSPTTSEMMTWGATNTDAVNGGDYWRLFTSNYLHYGILHLAVNMLSLHNVGRMLEKFIGTTRFALLYTVTGIFASSVSIWWNPYGVGVGASGAILGIVGVLAALLTTNLIEKSIRMQMLRSIGFSILLMLVIGMNAGIDNAAHIGGLLSGAIGGYFIYPELRAHFYQHKKQYWGLIAGLLLIFGGAGWFVMNSTSESPVVMLSEAQRMEMTAEANYNAHSYTTGEEIRKNVIPSLDSSAVIFTELAGADFNEEGIAEINRHLDYIHARKMYYEYIAKSLDTKDPVYDDSIRIWNQKSLDVKPVILVPEL